MSPAHPIHATPPAPQAGVVLIVVMVMLVVIGLVSATAMRAAMSADRISHNALLESLAKQATQIGLRYCEAEVSQATPVITIHAAPAKGSAPAWESFANWHGSAPKAVTVPESAMTSVDSPFVPNTRPQCLAEYHPASNSLIVITARGFSPDFQADTHGRTVAGSVVWFQSVVSVAPV